ncbi:MSMEG_0567/sll0787 family protein [uncultured Nocardioides sp.]|uniref:MSMEG_0567/sll0787 family protein n=1 Tax=uncultured Nocardioides sp. TaxID=198441 RepID=UPI00261B0D5C|nr:MSMEG_0567/sll0787 family protein [uncultured Nocardioides sp.]
MLDHGILTGLLPAAGPRPLLRVERAETTARAAHDALRRAEFVDAQGLFGGHDRDDVDDDPRTVVLLARSIDGDVLGGVRVHPAAHPATASRDLGWWRGSRLVVAPTARGSRAGVAAALVRAACATAEDAGALRFDAAVQARHAGLFTRLGWRRRSGPTTRHGVPHVEMEWPVGRVQRLVDATKAPLAGLLGRVTDHPLGGGGPGWVGDDAAPVPGVPLVAACDAILPSMVERDPEWAGWCSVLVNLNDLAAMGASPVGLLDAVGARDASFARRVLRGLLDAAEAWGVPVLGGHTQLGVPAALSVTALGATPHPVPGGGGRPGHALRVSADLGGGWRPGYSGSQWDSTTSRTPAELRATGGVVRTLDPAAAKDVSMAGTVGTVGMLAEASGCRAVVDVADVPTPDVATTGDWLTCFPGFAVVTTDRPGRPADGLPATVTSRVCGDLVEGAGVGLRWPDGVVTEAVTTTVTGLGAA